MRQRAIMTRLAETMEALSSEDRQSLLAFAEFLSARAAGLRTVIAAPVPSSCRGEETVGAAIKRLSAQYPMLDKGKLLNVSSRLMSEHVLHGRKTDEVIAELQQVFEKHYQDFVHGDHSAS
jgi:hypothetical protein